MKTDKYQIVHTNRIKFGNSYFVILPDVACGRKNRYVVYRIPTTGMKTPIIIGRELPLGFAKKIVEKYVKV